MSSNSKIFLLGSHACMVLSRTCIIYCITVIHCRTNSLLIYTLYVHVLLDSIHFWSVRSSRAFFYVYQQSSVLVKWYQCSSPGGGGSHDARQRWWHRSIVTAEKWIKARRCYRSHLPMMIACTFPSTTATTGAELNKLHTLSSRTPTNPATKPKCWSRRWSDSRRWGYGQHRAVATYQH